MSRKHYILIAKVLRDHADLDLIGATSVDREHFDQLVERLISALSEDNPAFNSATFLNAVRGDS